MRKFLPLVLILSLGVLLSSCSPFPWEITSNENTVNRPTEDLSGLTYPPFTTADPEGVYRIPSVQNVSDDDVGIHPEGEAYDITDPDGEPILRVSISMPVISYVNNVGLQSSADALLAATEKIFSDRVNSIAARYKSDAAAGYPFFLTPSYSVTYTITSFSESRVSLLYTVTETNADGLVSRSHVCQVIDLSAAFSVDLSTLFTAGLSDRLLTLVNRTLANADVSLYPGYESIAASLLPSAFLIERDGICFYFSAGTLAPADQGDIPVRLSTDVLNELLSEYGAVLLSAKGANVPEEADGTN